MRQGLEGTNVFATVCNILRFSKVPVVHLVYIYVRLKVCDISMYDLETCFTYSLSIYRCF